MAASLSVACELFYQSGMNAARGLHWFVSWFYSAIRCWPRLTSVLNPQSYS